MKIVFIVPTTALRRIPMYRWGGKVYGQSNSITGPLILGGILKKAGHTVEAYEELNGSIHFKRLLKDTDVFCISIMTSNSLRGCPFRCTFCTTSRMFAPYRQRSIDNVIAEIRMYKEMGFKYLNFEDDNFTADKERAKEICRRMIAENLTFKETFFFGRTDLADDEELLQLLHDAHLTRVLIGIESLNQEALNSIHKGQNIENIRRAGAACQKYGIRLIASIVLGLDEDRIEDMNRSIQFAKDITPTSSSRRFLRPSQARRFMSSLKRKAA